MAQADILLNQVLNNLQLNGQLDLVKYSNIHNIVTALQNINNQNPINAKTTGTITERLCEIGLRASVPGLYSKIGRDWNWMADFSIFGSPFNLLISVKSFKTKERLIASGSGNNLSPTLGWGLFDDPSEFGLSRVRSYLYRSFIAIYAPSQLISQLNPPVLAVTNINGRPLIRSLNTFVSDLQLATLGTHIDITRI